MTVVFIKRINLSDILFDPDNLKGIKLPFYTSGYCFLSNPHKIKKIIDSNKIRHMKKRWIIKGIASLNSKHDNFWVPFYCEEEKSNIFTQGSLPIFPFKVLINDKIDVKTSEIEGNLESKLTNYKVNLQLRIFPVGVGIVQLTLYLNPEVLDLEKVPKTINPFKLHIKYNNEEYNLFDFFDYVTNLLVNKIFINPKAVVRKVDGLYSVINFIGKDLSREESLIQLSKILTAKSNPSIREIEVERDKILGSEIPTKDNDDIFLISNKTGVLYVDKGLRKRRKYLIKGRRCCRGHFVNSIELAYITEHLLEELNAHFKKLNRELVMAQEIIISQSKAIKYCSDNIFDPCVFTTLMNNVLTVINKLDPKWIKMVYIYAAKEFNLVDKIMETEELTNLLLKNIHNWNLQIDKIKQANEKRKIEKISQTIRVAEECTRLLQTLANLLIKASFV